jgi:hypothetical protein
VLTAVVHAKPGETLPHVRFARVVVEADSLIEEWTARGVPRKALTVVYPGIDLERYAFAPLQRTDRLRFLFASSPSESSEIDARGIPLLIELARARPDIEIVVPWRSWGDVAGTTAVLDALRPPPNFHVRREPHADMRRHFAHAHATIVCSGCRTAVPGDARQRTGEPAPDVWRGHRPRAQRGRLVRGR